MTNLSWIDLLAAFFAGTIISLFYHGGLWWTVKLLPRARMPVLLSIGSFYLRMAFTLAAFFLVMRNDWRRMVVCLIGFLVVKFIITRRVRPYKKAGLQYGNKS